MQKRTASSESSKKLEIQTVFLTQMDQLLLPAYLLTDSHEVAAECFLEAWENCVEALSYIDRDFLFSAAKRSIIEKAIQKIAEDQRNCISNGCQEYAADIERDTEDAQEWATACLTSAKFRRALLRLNPFQRAALILRIYEGYSSADAGLLLRVPRQSLENAWQQGLSELIESLDCVEYRNEVVM